MVTNNPNFRVGRRCKFCKSTTTGISFVKGNRKRYNWYIDKSDPEGGWMCSKCYHQIRRNNTFIKSSVEFNVTSINPIYNGVLFLEV